MNRIRISPTIRIAAQVLKIGKATSSIIIRRWYNRQGVELLHVKQISYGGGYFTGFRRREKRLKQYNRLKLVSRLCRVVDCGFFTLPELLLVLEPLTFLPAFALIRATAAAQGSLIFLRQRVFEPSTTVESISGDRNLN